MNLFKSYMNQKVTINFIDNTMLEDVVIIDVDSLFFTIQCCKEKIYSINCVKSIELFKETSKEVKIEKQENKTPVDYSALVDKLPEFPDN